MELNDKNRKIENEEKFFEWFISTENKRISNTTVLVTTARGPQTYANLNGGTQSVDLVHRALLIVKDLLNCPYIGTAVVLDTDRLFTEQQRYRLWENQGGVCPVTGKTIPESEINDHNLWHADHIVPYSKGGQTTLDNGQLICKTANLVKGDKLAA